MSIQHQALEKLLGKPIEGKEFEELANLVGESPTVHHQFGIDFYQFPKAGFDVSFDKRIGSIFLVALFGGGKAGFPECYGNFQTYTGSMPCGVTFDCTDSQVEAKFLVEPVRLRFGKRPIPVPANLTDEKSREKDIEVAKEGDIVKSITYELPPYKYVFSFNTLSGGNLFRVNISKMS